MLARAVPLAACLLWLACEAHFSPRVFIDNVRFSAAEIKGGLDALLATKYLRAVKVAENVVEH